MFQFRIISNTWIIRALSLIGATLVFQAAWAAPTIELKIDDAPYQGLNIAHNQKVCWLAARDGSYECVDLSRVTSFRKVSGEFRSLSPSALARELRKTLGRKFAVRNRGPFVICAPTEKLDQYAELLLHTEKSFNGYFNRRGWSLKKMEFPLVVVVHPNKREFDRDCLSLGMKPDAYLHGFYHPQTNRVTLYDVDSDLPAKGTVRTISSNTNQLSVSARSVAIHETIHQMAFNSGLHQRIGETPRWVVEGLATMLEAGAMDSASRNDTTGRINHQRLRQFMDYRAHRRQGTLIDFVSRGDELYQSAPLDFYSETWALTFYLSEARRPDYIRYLKRLADRDPLASTGTTEEQLQDLQAIFGKDLRWLETRYLRFIDGLE